MPRQNPTMGDSASENLLTIREWVYFQDRKIDLRMAAGLNLFPIDSKALFVEFFP
jgi:hypothetical protein